jgi:hypothetical protein
MEYKVYILKVKDTNDIRYVGITSGKLNTRLNKHLHDIKRESCKNNYKKNWLNYRDSIVIEQIDSANSIDELKNKEIFYIEKYSLDGKYIIFDCAAEAAQHFNLKREKIVMVCNGKRNHTGGIIFRYKKGTNE